MDNTNNNIDQNGQYSKKRRNKSNNTQKIKWHITRPNGNKTETTTEIFSDNVSQNSDEGHYNSFSSEDDLYEPNNKKKRNDGVVGKFGHFVLKDDKMLLIDTESSNSEYSSSESENTYISDNENDTQGNFVWHNTFASGNKEKSEGDKKQGGNSVKWTEYNDEQGNLLINSEFSDSDYSSSESEEEYTSDESNMKMTPRSLRKKTEYSPTTSFIKGVENFRNNYENILQGINNQNITRTIPYLGFTPIQERGIGRWYYIESTKLEKKIEERFDEFYNILKEFREIKNDIENEISYLNSELVYEANKKNKISSELQNSSLDSKSVEKDISEITEEKDTAISYNSILAENADSLVKEYNTLMLNNPSNFTEEEQNELQSNLLMQSYVISNNVEKSLNETKMKSKLKSLYYNLLETPLLEKKLSLMETKLSAIEKKENTSDLIVLEKDLDNKRLSLENEREKSVLLAKESFEKQLVLIDERKDDVSKNMLNELLKSPFISGRCLRKLNDLRIKPELLEDFLSKAEDGKKLELTFEINLAINPLKKYIKESKNNSNDKGRSF